MKNYQLFLLSFMAVPWLFLSGFTNPAVADNLKPKAVAESHKTGRHGNTTEQPAMGQEQQAKPLDLSVSFKAIENGGGNTAAITPSPDKTSTNAMANLFAPEPKKTTRPLQLKGDLLMSPEPEAEKRKSVDGAGIVINVKP